MSQPQIKLPATYPDCVTGTLDRAALANFVVFGDSYTSHAVRDLESAANTSQGHRDVKWPDYIEICARSTIGTKVHNFAYIRATAEDDLAIQLSRFFEQYPDATVLKPGETTYALFFGINDTSFKEEFSDIIDKVTHAARTLYAKVGARQFVFVDVPPMDRAPDAVDFQEIMPQRVAGWNKLLPVKVAEFQRDVPEANIVIFSAHAVLKDVLDRPHEYGFDAVDSTKEGGAIWSDDCHVSSTVNEILARRLLEKVL